MILTVIAAALTLAPFNEGWEVRREGAKAWAKVTVPHDAAFDRG